MLSERRYCVARRLCVCVCVCVCVRSAVYTLGVKAMSACHISLGGEGNALYPVFSSCVISNHLTLHEVLAASLV